MAYENALSNVNQIQSTLQTQGMEAYEYSRLLRLSEVEIWKKYAQALVGGVVGDDGFQKITTGL